VLTSSAFGGGKNGSSWSRWLGPESARVAAGDKGPNRWMMFAPAFATHACLGAPFGWSAVSPVLAAELGVAAPAALDWTLAQTTAPMSVTLAFGGLTGAILGKWRMKVGTRAGKNPYQV